MKYVRSSEVFVPVVLVFLFVWSKTDFDWGILTAFVVYLVLSPVMEILHLLEESR